MEFADRNRLDARRLKTGTRPGGKDDSRAIMRAFWYRVSIETRVELIGHQ